MRFCKGARVVNGESFFSEMKGSLWVPIFFHGLIDTPMQFESLDVYTSQVTGTPNWGLPLAQFIVYSSIGSALIKLSDHETNVKLVAKIKNYFVETEGPTQATDQ